MRRIWLSLSVLVVGGALMMSGACGESEEVKMAAAREAAWTELEAAKQVLDSKRQEVLDLKEQIAAMGEAEQTEAAETVEGAEDAADTPTLEELTGLFREAETEAADLAEKFGLQLVTFINEDPPVEGVPLSDLQKAAIRMKSGEDALLAQEYIDKGGDYRRAIEIYETALTVDTDNEEIQAKLEEAKALRYMTEDRFSAVKKKMTEDEVREILGAVNLRNIREYPERNVTAWFYPKEDNGAAGVYFEKDKKSGELRVYEAKYDAVEAPKPGGEE